MQRAVQGTLHCVEAVYPLDCVTNGFGGNNAHRYMNAPDNKHAILLFDFSGHVGTEFALTGVDLARFQRTSEGS